MKKAHPPKFLLIFLVLVASAYGFWIYISNYVYKSKAGGEPAINVSFSEKTGPHPININKSIDVVYTPVNIAHNITSFSVVYLASGSAQIVDVNPIKGMIVNGGTQPTFTEIKKEIAPSRARVAYVVLPSSGAGNVRALTMEVTIKGTAVGAGTLKIDVDNFEMAGSLVPDFQFALGTVDQGNYTFVVGDPTGTPGPTLTIMPPISVTLPISPSTSPTVTRTITPTTPPTIPTPTPKKYKTTIKTRSVELSYNDFYIKVGNKKFEVNDAKVTTNSVLGNPNYTTLEMDWQDKQSNVPMRLYLYFSAQAGKWQTDEIQSFDGTNPGNWIIYNGVGQSGNEPSGTIGKPYQSEIFEATRLPLSGGGGNQPAAILHFEDISILPFTEQITPVITATPQITGTVSKITMKIKLQGVAQKRAAEVTIPVKVTIAGANLPREGVSQSVKFTLGEAGVWTGTFENPYVFSGSNYIVYIKGPKHIQKKICVVNPTELNPGTYRCQKGEIRLQGGDNNLDFTGITMPIGDLPEQNGVVNSGDITLIRTSLGKSDETSLSLADVNYDGVVNTQDFSLLIEALEVRPDDVLE